MLEKIRTQLKKISGRLDSLVRCASFLLAFALFFWLLGAHDRSVIEYALLTIFSVILALYTYELVFLAVVLLLLPLIVIGRFLYDLFAGSSHRPSP